MSVNSGSIYYSVDIDTDKTLRAQDKIDGGFDKLQKGMDDTDKSAGRLSTSLTPLAAAIGGLISIQAIVNLQKMAEQFTVLNARVARLSVDSQDAAENYRALINISSMTGATLPNTVALWESLSGTLKEMGRTNADVLRLTETLQKIGTVGGTSANDMSNALRQLGQGLAGGVIRAEEFNSVLEGMPELARQIAAGLGIPFSELRQRMKDGQLTAEDVLNAIENRTAVVNEEFAKIPRTVSQASNAIVNEMGAAISVMDKAVGVSGTLAKVLDAIAKGIRLTSGNLTDQERLNELFTERQTLLTALASTEGTWRENMPGAVANRERLKTLETELLAIQNKRIEAQKKEAAEAAPNASTNPAVTPAANTEDGQKSLDRLRQQLELSKLQGEARAKLAAIQQLGAKATQEEKDEAAKLAAEIFRLNEAQKAAGGSTVKLTEAQKAAKKSAEEMASAQGQDVKVITSMAEALYQASLGATELAQRQAELALSEYATPDQIASVRQLAAELQRVRDIEQRKEEFGDTPQDVAATITGQVAPLSGGMFDSQSARYDAEAEAERVRYEEQLARLNEAKALELQTLSSYQDLEAQLAQTHADRMAQIEMAKNQAMLASGQQLFEGLAGATAAFAGEQSGAYKALFAISKGFALADAAIKIQQGIASAASLGWPAMIPALASVAAATGGVISTISGTNFSGRAMGGPVQANQMYRVNEGGKPEIFNAANGSQYMMPNQRGEVVSNKDAQGGGEPTVIVNIQNNASGTTATATSSKDDRGTIIDVVVSDIMQNGRVAQAVNRTTGTRRAGG